VLRWTISLRWVPSHVIAADFHVPSPDPLQLAGLFSTSVFKSKTAPIVTPTCVHSQAL
jgi:hypothetical protein